jgi:hypothetical protein
MRRLSLRGKGDARAEARARFQRIAAVTFHEDPSVPLLWIVRLNEDPSAGLSADIVPSPEKRFITVPVHPAPGETTVAARTFQ